MPSLLEITEAITGYGHTQVLNELSLNINEGDSIGICGPNGHGKTTLMRTISGLIRLWSGDIRFDGQSIATTSPQAIMEQGLIHVPQGNQMFPGLSVGENLSLAAYSKRARSKKNETIEKVYSLFPKLQARHKQKCHTLSGGERQMLAVSVGLMASPRLLILDEPNLGLAPIVKEELGRAIHDIASHNITLIVVEQDIDFLRKLANRLLIVEHGGIITDTDVTGDMSTEEVLNRYFGESV